MNVENIQKQIAVLEQFEKVGRKFHLAVYINHECGTTACAVGWLAISGVVPGLHPSKDETFLTHGIVFDDGTNHWHDHQAIKKVFDFREALPGLHDAADFIFFAGIFTWGKDADEITPRDVVERLRLLLDLGEVEFIRKMETEWAERKRLAQEGAANAL